MGQCRLSPEAPKNAEAREPLAQFPGFDVDEPFKFPGARQAGTGGF